MDDPDEDWEIDGQNTCECLECGGGGKCNVKWVLEKGLNLGKKVVITGFVMSSAPVVLPSILVVSAVGFAFSVPFGLVFTGYACTQKLMSTLLPMPTASPMLEYDQTFDDEVEEVEGGGKGKDRIESRVYMEEEEKGQMDDLRENEVPRKDGDSKDIRRYDQMFDDKAEEVEGRRERNEQIESHVHMEEDEKEQLDDQRTGIEESIELVKNENEVPQEDDDFKDIRRDDELRMGSKNISLKEEGYEEDVDESLVYNHESSEEMVARADMGQEEAINQESKCEESFPKDDALKPSDCTNSGEEEKEKMDEVPREDDSKDTRRDDVQMMTSENISTKEEGYEEEDDEPLVDNNESSEEMVALPDVGQEESLKSSDWSNSKEEEKEQMDDLKGVEESSIELVKREDEGPWEDDDSKDIRRDDELRMTSENIGLNKGHEQGDELVADNNESSEEMVSRADVGQEESINQESKSAELFPKDDALKPSDWSNSGDEEKEQMVDPGEGVEESTELVKQENEVPKEEDESKDIRTGDQLRMTTENTNLKEGHEGDDVPIVSNNESSEEVVARDDVGQEESIVQVSKSKELSPKEDALKNSDWTNSREVEGEWEVTELIIEGEEDIGSEESINENIVGENVGPGVFGEFSERQTRINNEEEDIKRGSVGLLEKIKDEGNADDAAKETKNKKDLTTEGSAEMLLLEVKDQSVISQNLTVDNGGTENQQNGHDKRQKLEDSSEVSVQEPPVGGAAGSDDLIPLQENITPSYPPRESDDTSCNEGAYPMVIENVEVVEISVTAGRPKAADAESSEVDSVLPTEKEFADEEKIRERIDALRTIVGYKSTTYRSSVEEVKALYTFTGVELPSSFGDPSDLEELGNKLCFLMSILGVK